MLKWVTWSILVKIFHKTSPTPSHPSKNTVKWFQSKWNQEKPNAQTPPKPAEFLLTLRQDPQETGKHGALTVWGTTPTPANAAGCARIGPPLQAGLLTKNKGLQCGQTSSEAQSSLQSAACPQRHSPPCTFHLGETNRDAEEKVTLLLSFLHMGNWGRQISKVLSLLFFLPKELQKQFSPRDFCQRLYRKPLEKPKAKHCNTKPVF